MKQDFIISILEEHFKSFLGIEGQGIWVSIILNRKSLKWFSFKENTPAYKVFSSQMNNLQLTMNLFENLILLEDLRNEMRGKNDFTIDIPNWYFRFPSNNDPRQKYGAPLEVILNLHPDNLLPEITEQEEMDINRVIEDSKGFFKMGKDESIVREMMYRLEFLSMFGFFEVYLIDLLSNTIKGGDEKECIKIRKESMNLSLDEFLEKVLNEIDPNLMIFIKKIHSGIFKYLHFCYLARNIHIHNLGRFNKITIEKGLKKKIFIEIPGYSDKDEDGKYIKPSYDLNINDFQVRQFSIGDHLSLSLIVANFRGIIMIVSEVIEFYIKQKSDLLENCEEINYK